MVNRRWVRRRNRASRGGLCLRRRDPDDENRGCFDEKEKCVWELASKLLPSDRRRGDLFGWDVAISDTTGRAAVGAPGASATTHWKLPPPKRPVGRAPPRDAPTAWTQYLKEYETAHVGSDYIDRGAPVRLPMDRHDTEKYSRDLRMASRQDVPARSGAQAFGLKDGGTSRTASNLSTRHLL